MVRGRGYAQSRADLENIALGATDERRADPRQGRRQRRARSGPPPRRRGPRRRRRSGVGHRRHAAGRERAGRHRPRQGEDSARSSRGLPPGVKVVPIYDRSEPDPAARSTTVNAHARRDHAHGRARHPAVPLAHAERDDPGPHDPGRRADRLHPVPAARAHRQHHVARRHRHRRSARWSTPRSSSSSRRTRGWSAGAQRPPRRLSATSCIGAVKEVGGPSFFALLVIGVSFLPVLTLEAQEGRLFKPLAYTKTLCDARGGGAGDHARSGAAAAVHAGAPVRFRPRGCAARSTPSPSARSARRSASDQPRLIRAYEPVARLGAAPEVGRPRRARWPCCWRPCRSYLRLGSEFMPPLDEGTLLYMPSTMPGISIGEAQKLLQIDRPDHQAVPRSRAACSARPAAPRRRPTRRRCRCSRRSSP